MNEVNYLALIPAGKRGLTVSQLVDSIKHVGTDKEVRYSIEMLSVSSLSLVSCESHLDQQIKLSVQFKNQLNY